VTEGSASAVFTVTLNAPSPQTVAVHYAAANGTAAAGSDFAATAGSLSFAPGTTSRTLAVAVVGDSAIEADETFYVNLSSPANATIARAQARGTIRNDDHTPIVPPSGEAVVWTSPVGVSVSGNSLRKTASTAWGNAGAASTKQLSSGSGYVEITASETTTKRMFGLGNGNATANYADIEFALYLDGRAVKVYEKGTYRGTYGTFAAGDKLRVAVESGAVRYRRNGALFHTSPLAATYPLRVDTALYSNGATLGPAVVSGGWTAATVATHTPAVVWTAAVGVSVSGSSLRKTSSTGWGNAGAISTKRLPAGQGAVEVTASEVTTNRMFGLGNGNGTANYGDIEYGLDLSSGEVKVYEKGVHRGTFGRFAQGDKLRVAVESGAVKYRRNGTLLYTSKVAPTYPLVVDAALYSNGATLTSAVLSGSWQ
jgi:hypothetical protein